MNIEYVSTDAAAPPSAAYSQAIALEKVIVTGGQVGISPGSGQLGQGVAEQIRIAIGNLDAVLRSSGSSLVRAIKVNCYLADVSDFVVFDQIYREYFTEPFPPRTTVGVAFPNGILFEIEAWAVREESNE